MKKIVTLAALRSFYDSGNDLLGVFGNLALRVTELKSLSMSNIQKLLENKFKIKIPYDVLRKLLKRLRRNNLIDYKNIVDIERKSIFLTSKGGV